MATYNGEKYILNQLQSLADQIQLPDELVVGDDGSSDATLDIIEDFRTRAPFSVRIHRNEVNLGYARNFLTTAKRCQGDWIAFCDQDDLWLSNKLAETVKAVSETNDCCMVLQNAWLCNDTLTERRRKFPNKLEVGIHRSMGQYGFWVWLGCLQSVRRDVVDLWDNESLPLNSFPRHIEMSHDKWTCMIANALGGIAVLGTPVALYRRHETTVTGQYNQQSFGERIADARKVSGEHYDYLAEVATEYSGYMQGLAQRTNNPIWESAFRDNAQAFSRLSEIQQLRGRLYAARRFRERLTMAMQIASKGGYLGKPFHAMGLSSAFKDLSRVFVGSRL